MEQWRRLPIQALVLATPAPMFWSITKAFFQVFKGNSYSSVIQGVPKNIFFWDAFYYTPSPIYWGIIDAFFFVN